MSKSPRGRTWRLAALTGLLLAGPALARFAFISEPVPVERLVTNLTAYIRKHPKNARGHYTLGRIHSLAFASAEGDVEVVTKNFQTSEPLELPGFAPYHTIRVSPEPLPEKITPAQRQHLAASVKHYGEAVKLAPKEGLYWMGLGWMLEHGARYAAAVDAPFLPRPGKARPAVWRERALAAYRKAYTLTRAADLQLEHLGPQRDVSISLEAGEGILRLLEGRKPTVAEQQEQARVRETIRLLQSKPRVVTPIIFPLDGPAPLADLLATDRTVTFDLAGDGRAERWPWVGPRTGVLVWDPERTGRITSGRQLFGSFTWSMFWRHGYEPLAALDNDRDGWLAGDELTGISVWRDANGNAQSEPGEVTTAAEYGIMRIAVRPAGKSSGVPANSRGLQRRDGSWLPTYDWMPTSLSPQKPNAR